MKIKLSRHARRRAKLYKIPEHSMDEVLKPLDLGCGEHEIIKNIKGYKFPIKIIIAVEGALGTVITTYPLKKGRKK